MKQCWGGGSVTTYGSAKAVTSLVLKPFGFEYPWKIIFERILLVTFKQDILPVLETGERGGEPT